VTQTITTADGAKHVVTTMTGWFDTKRNEPCTLSIAADGKQRGSHLLL
jgi:hypothetical protein